MATGWCSCSGILRPGRWPTRPIGTIPTTTRSPGEIDGTEFGDPASAIYVAYNGWSGSVNFRLPSPGSDKNWYRVTDTCNWADGPDTAAVPGTESRIGGQGGNYSLCGQALLLLIAK